MKLLLIHSDFIEYEPKKKAIASAEEIELKSKKFDECLVVFCSAEDGDTDKAAESAITEIKSVAGQVGAKKIIVYPFVHLSSNPAKPASALKFLKQIENGLGGSYEVHRAPFGWYKAFTIKCKGHPLAELSKQITSESVKKDLAASKKKIKDEEYDPKQLLRQISKIRLNKEVLKDNDHRILGQKLDLFSFNETAPGMVFWHANGLTIYNELVEFWRDEHRKAGYQEISTPQVIDKKLWQISGHWEKYRENIFLTEYEGRDFAVKPMNCPGGLLVFKARPKSYRDLPLRVSELGIVHRQELSGVLSGLFRIIKFTQDDAHILCNEEQLESEIEAIMSMVDRFYKKFGFTYHVELSTRPEKRIGADKLWDKAESILEDVLKKKKMNYKLNPGDGAFYGPKIDFHIKDSLGRTWQCATIQLDFAMPERFELEYIDRDNRPKRPVMLHRVIYGSVERFIGVLLEHTNGNLPVWLSPLQARVISFTDRNVKSAENILNKLKEAGIRADEDFSSSTVNDKVRNAELMKIPYIIVVGDKEEQNNTIAVRQRGQKPKFGIKPDDFIEETLKMIKERA
jgi:threonyl-tRNA synthetase